MSNITYYYCKYCNRCFSYVNEKIEHERYCTAKPVYYIKDNPSSTTIQIDGDHYKNLAIQPAVYSYKNKLNWHEGEIIKYVTRHRNKNGKVDLEKARHLIDMLIELEYEN